jgi:hypothetical protein
VIAHNPHHPAPLLFSAACAAAETMSLSANGRRVRPCFVWSGQTYYKCRDCDRWRPKSNFSGVFNPKSACGIQSYCKPCHSRRTYAAQLRREGAADHTSRKDSRKNELRERLARNDTSPTAILPKVVNPTVVVVIPSSSYTAPKPSTRQVEYVPDAPAPRSTVARVIATDGENPARAGMDAAAFAVAQERGRFDKARQYNPALTWEGWITVAGKKRGRPPRRDSGTAKGVGLA